MKTKTLLLIAILFSYSIPLVQAQNLTGNYSVTGYFFHPSAPRALNLAKTITQISANTYQADLGDLGGGGFSFQFTVDGTNHLTNWVAVNATYPAPACGFMTADNPGGFTYTVSPGPGMAPWVQSTYNNTYDPATRTFYMHYGYNSTAIDQNGYDRQVYENWMFVPPVKITSVKPLRGTSGTKVIIKGRNFSNVDPAGFLTISFGQMKTDTAYVDSDNKITAFVGGGASGPVTVGDIYGSIDSVSGFRYIPVPPVTHPQWRYVGKAGFSQHTSYFVSAASGTDNVPFVAFVDSATGRTRVMKYNEEKWVAVGGDVSDGKSVFTSIVLTNRNTPIVAYIDSVNGGAITVKKFNAGNWLTLGTAGFAPASGNIEGPFSMAIDNSNILYVLSINGFPGSISVYKFTGSGWLNVGTSGFAVTGSNQVNLAIDKTSNTPYVIFDDINFPAPNYVQGFEATVMKFDGTGWVTVGAPGFTTGRNGAFYTDIKIDGKGNPVASMQDDNGFERQSIYKYSGGNWIPVGYPRFSKCHSYYNTVSIDMKNNIYALFEDATYNGQGTVMKYHNDGNKWDYVGARGFMPFFNFFERNTLIFNSCNTPMVAFSDKNHGGKVSVMEADEVLEPAITTFESKDNMSIINGRGISIFPNPAHSSISVNFLADDVNTTFRVFDEKGQSIMQKQIASYSGQNTTQIDVSKLASGAYILLIKTKSGIQTKQFVKE